MALPLQTVLDRVANLEKAALAALAAPVTADAKDHFFYTQTAMPYFTNRLGPLAVTGDSEDYDLITVDIRMRLVIGHLTEGYEGVTENNLQLYIPQILEYFNERRLLIDSTYTSDIAYLVEARIVDCLGLAVFQQSGIGAAQVGTEFTLRCQFQHDLIQVYE